MASASETASETAGASASATASKTAGASTYEMASEYIITFEKECETLFETANTMENKIVNRALTVVKSNPEWIDYVKNFNQHNGFMFADSALLEDIKDAIDTENPIHSGASLAMCLQQCKKILNNS